MSWKTTFREVKGYSKVRHTTDGDLLWSYPSRLFSKIKNVTNVIHR